MGVWSAIRGMWARHDERVAEHELEKESADGELPGIAEQPASARAGGVIPNPAAQADETPQAAE